MAVFMVVCENVSLGRYISAVAVFMVVCENVTLGLYISTMAVFWLFVRM